MSSNQGPEPDPTTRSLAIAQLIAAAQSRQEIDVLTRVGLRVGFLWVCPVCGDPQFADRDTCCGNSRPLGP